MIFQSLIFFVTSSRVEMHTIFQRRENQESSIEIQFFNLLE